MLVSLQARSLPSSALLDLAVCAHQSPSQCFPANPHGSFCLQGNGDLVSNAVDLAGSIDAMNSAAVLQVHLTVVDAFWSRVPSHAQRLHTPALLWSAVVLRRPCLCCAGERLESGNSQPPAPKVCRQLQVATIRPGLGHRVKVETAEKPALAPWEWHASLPLPSAHRSVAVQPLSASWQCLCATPSHLLLQYCCRQADIRQPPEMLAIDCEMCEVAGNKRELLGLSVINAARQTVLKVSSTMPLPHSLVS